MRRHVFRRSTWPDRKSTRLNSSHTEIYTLSLHDALPICCCQPRLSRGPHVAQHGLTGITVAHAAARVSAIHLARSEEHTSELQSHRDLHSFPTRRSSDLLLSAALVPRTPRRPARSDGHNGRSCGGTCFGDPLG